MATKKGIGYSMLTEKIYLGNQNKEKGIWIGNKEDITSDFINVMFEYLPKGTCRQIRGLDTNSINLFLNINKEDESIKKAINYLNKLLINK